MASTYTAAQVAITSIHSPDTEPTTVVVISGSQFGGKIPCINAD